MRIANSTIARNYTNSLNRNFVKLNDANMKVTTQRKFTSMAEDTASGVRAMNIRRNLSQIDSYIDNAKTSQSQFASAEKTLMQISDITKDIQARYTNAMNGTNSPQEREIFATELTKLRDEILTSANGQFSDRFLFGGTNTQSPPFTVDAAGDLFYNNVKVSEINKTGDDAYLFSDAAFVDIGLGMTMQSGDSQKVVENSAFKSTLVGLDFLGSGDENLYLVINELIDSLQGSSFDAERGGALLDKFKTAANGVTTQITKLGADSQYLDFTVDRLNTEALNLMERQNQIETIDPAAAITDFKMQEYIYNAALQMGQRLLQPTLFSFIN